MCPTLQQDPQGSLPPSKELPGCLGPDLGAVGMLIVRAVYLSCTGDCHMDLASLKPCHSLERGCFCHLLFTSDDVRP